MTIWVLLLLLFSLSVLSLKMNYANRFLVALAVKNLPCTAQETRDTGSVPGLGRSPGGGNGNPLQYSCLESQC